MAEECKKTGIAMSTSSNVVFGGNLAFDHNTQEWSIFKERFVSMCFANELTDSTDKAGTKRRSILLTTFVEETYRVARDLVFPSTLNTIEYSTLIEKLDTHFESPKCSFAERYKFYKAEQRPGEDLGDWAARVRSLAQFCGFTTELDTALRDRFVLGLENAKEREKLFAESVDQLTFSRALHLAQATRSARLAMLTTGPSGPTMAAGVSDGGEVFAIRSGPAAAAAGGATGYNTSRKCCAVCGYKNHPKEKCRYANYSCKKCNTKGHLSRVCKVKDKLNNFIAEDSDDIHEGMRDVFLYAIKCDNGKPMQQLVSIANEPVLSEIDSGSAVSVLPANVFNNLFEGKYSLKRSNVRLNCYNGSKILPLGRVSLSITFEKQTKEIEFFVIETALGQPVLLGRDFISKFGLHFCNLNCNNLNTECDFISTLKKKYAKVFSNELGRFNKYKINLKLKEDAQFKFCKPRPVPLALKPKVEEELDRLVKLGILEKISHSDIATPIVPVLRPDGNIRICGDYSVTLNKALFIDNYPLPRIEDLFSKLHGGEEFSKLDLSRAYNQCELDESSKNLTCINTHKGLYRYTRLVFGLSSAPCIFQQIIERLLQGIEGICIFLDDVLITGPNRKIHVERLEQVLSRLSDAGLCLKQDKCELFKNSVEYLGFVIDKHGLHKAKSKVDAILRAKSPKNVSELQSFLGMLNYYRPFIPNASGILKPLYVLLKKDSKWNWSAEQEKSFRQIKEELAGERVLAHYHPEYPTILTTDAGPALGAVLAQTQPDGSERVIAYASRSLTPSEKNYAQIQKEAASIIFGIKKFHYYLYGRSLPFILRTDHKPLVSIFGSKKGVPELAANRLQRYAIFMSAYNYKIEHIRSERNVADFLSRATVDDWQGCPEGDLVDRATYINFISDTLKPVTAKDICLATDNDIVLNRVKSFILKGWPRKVEDGELKTYFNCRTQLSLEEGCILRGHKVIIPSVFREQLLNELHDSHLGVVKTKSEARKRMWWPKIDEHIEQKIGSCSVCFTLRNAPPRCPLAPWPYPAGRWQRVHLDMCALQGRQFLIAVDAHSKWVECYEMTRTDTVSIIIKLADMFSRFGLVQTLVTDNATNFCSDMFSKFCSLNEIKHITIAPYHPNSNGQAENSVKFVKKGIKAIIAQNPSQSTFKIKLSKLLFDYRNAVHCTTGFSPAQLLLGYSLRSRHDLLRVRLPEADTGPVSLASSANQNVVTKQILQCNQYGGRRKGIFKTGDNVLVKSFYKNGTKHLWRKGIIEKKIGSRMYIVKILDLNKKVKKHADQILFYKGNDVINNSNYDGDIPTLQSDSPTLNVTNEDAGCSTAPGDIPGSEARDCITVTNDVSADTSFESFVSPNVSPQRRLVEEEVGAVRHGLSGDLMEARETPDSEEAEGTETSDNVGDHSPSNHVTRRFPLRSTRSKGVNYKI